jgi:glycerophosphoryl diester phosphodiesterase
LILMGFVMAQSNRRAPVEVAWWAAPSSSLAFVAPRTIRDVLFRPTPTDRYDSSSSLRSTDLSGRLLVQDVLGKADIETAEDAGLIREKSLAAKLGVDPHQIHARRPHIIGHRGSLYRELENTLQSFKTSYQIGCDAVELDVFLLKCGELVVFHGGGTDQNAGCLIDYMNLDASILDYTAAEARRLRFNPNYEEFGCGPERIRYMHDIGLAYIPTLREVLTDLRDTTDLKITIELKSDGTELPALALVEELGMVDRCCFSSFNHDRIRRIRELRPHRKNCGSHVYRTGALFADDVPDDFIERVLDLGASEVHLKYDTCTKSRVDLIHANNMDSMVWMRGPIGMLQDTTEKYRDVGNEDELMYRTVTATGVRAMCVNKPDVLVSMIGRRANKP